MLKRLLHHFQSNILLLLVLMTNQRKEKENLLMNRLFLSQTFLNLSLQVIQSLKSLIFSRSVSQSMPFLLVLTTLICSYLLSRALIDSVYLWASLIHTMNLELKVLNLSLWDTCKLIMPSNGTTLIASIKRISKSENMSDLMQEILET